MKRQLDYKAIFSMVITLALVIPISHYLMEKMGVGEHLIIFGMWVIAIGSMYIIDLIRKKKIK